MSDPEKNDIDLNIEKKVKKKKEALRKYFLPVQASRSDNVKQLAKNKKGMFIIRWKKGLESLNLKEDQTTDEEDLDNSQQPSKEEEPSKIIITRALRKQGYGKYQTYANFLDGEEKEQYE